VKIDRFDRSKAFEDLGQPLGLQDEILHCHTRSITVREG
jgi:hypothetical protein